MSMCDCGRIPTSSRGKFTVTANIYSSDCNDYVHHWFGGVFSNHDYAYAFWNSWWPNKKEIDEIMEERRAEGDYSHHELEIGLWDEDGTDLEFYNETLDYENEDEDAMMPKYAYEAFLRIFPELKEKIAKYKTTKDPHTIELYFNKDMFRWPILFTFNSMLDWTIKPKSRKD